MYLYALKTHLLPGTRLTLGQLALCGGGIYIYMWCFANGNVNRYMTMNSVEGHRTGWLQFLLMQHVAVAVYVAVK